jgi:single-stranded DNA-binding protein
MTASVLISGKLFRDPERKMSRAMKPYVAATLRDGEGDAAQWWKLIVFSETACEDLLALSDGDAIAVSGAFKAEVYEQSGTTRLSLTCFVDRIISAHRPKKAKTERRLTAPAEERQHQENPIDDGIPENW